MRHRRFFHLLWTWAVLSCSGTNQEPGPQPPPPPPPPPPAPTVSMQVFEGQGQTGTVGQAVTILPAVRVTNQSNQPVSGTGVTFSAGVGGGTVTGASQTTDANGIARVGGWTLGTVAGPQTLIATAAAQGSPVAISATAIAGPAAAVTANTGDGQMGTVGAPLAIAPAVRVTDPFGNGVSGANVAFTVVSGGGSMTGGNQVTGTGGIASAGGWTLGTVVGVNTLSALVAGDGIAGNPVSFAATGKAGPPQGMVKAAGDNQSGTVGGDVPVPPAVDVTDAFGNPVAAADVLWVVSAGGGSVTGGQSTTNDLGRAMVERWTLGPTLGANTLTAGIGNLTATFSATALAPINAAQFAGTYSGTWTNATFGSMGTATAVVSVDDVARTVSAVVTVTGPVLGTPGVAPVNAQTPFTDAGASFQSPHPQMGNIAATIDAAGAITASGTNVPNAGIDRWDATGTLTNSALHLAFTVTFSAGPPATGTILLTKP